MIPVLHFTLANGHTIMVSPFHFVSALPAVDDGNLAAPADGICSTITLSTGVTYRVCENLVEIAASIMALSEPSP